jgi:hypothetical protein
MSDIAKKKKPEFAQAAAAGSDFTKNAPTERAPSAATEHT